MMLTMSFKKKSHIAHCSGKDKFIDYCRKERSYIDRIPVASLKGSSKTGYFQLWGSLAKELFLYEILNGTEKIS